MSKKIYKILLLVVILSLVIPGAAFGQGSQAVSAPIAFTILHTNDFHGQLVGSGSNPGSARVAQVVDDVRTAVGADNVLLVDAGDEMQGSLLSNLQQGEPVIATFNAMGYVAATFGNHEFDWGQAVLTARTTQADYPFVTANIVVNDTGNCSTAGWTAPDFAQPYVVETLNATGGTVKVGFIGVTTTETPTITIASATEGLCFKDPATSILHYYDTLKSQADVIVVLSHLGYNDGGYGYGIPVYGDKTLAQMLIDAGKPVPLIIGGHSHTDLGPLTGTPLPSTLPPNYTVVDGQTSVVQAYYNGRRVGRADLTFDPDTKAVTVNWQSLVVDPAGAQDAAINTLVNDYANDPNYLDLINEPIGYTNTDLLRNYNGDSMMADFVDDAIYGYLNGDGDTTNDVDLFLNNAGGIRTDWCAIEDPLNPGNYIWSSTAADCQTGLYTTHDPMLLTYGNMFTVLPFGNATVVGTMTGAQILDLLNQSATLGKGALQVAGLRYKFYRYSDALPGPQPYAWGAFDACVINKDTKACDPLDVNKTYKVGTNEFLAPAGGDNYAAFKYMQNITYWGDMLNAVNAYVTANYGTPETAYTGPTGDGQLDGRITRDGDDTGGSIIPVTVLHHNDSHGNLTKGTYVGYTQLATLINQERQHNPDRTLLLNGGDSIQGDAMMYYFKDAGGGFTSDGTALPPALQINPFIAVMNAMNYTAMTLGNHEFNFGSKVFVDTFTKAGFPILGANMDDSGAYGINKVTTLDVNGNPVVNVRDSLQVSLPCGLSACDGPISVGILGLTNHRVPNYELPSNIPGLSFYNPIDTAKALVPGLDAVDDVVLALTHIGFTTDPKSVEIDNNVDTNLAMDVSGIDAIIGAHSHTNPATGYGDYKYLPALIPNPDDQPVLVTQAWRYNNTLGEVIIGVRAKEAGGYEVVSRAGRYISVTKDTPEDPTIQAIVQPYTDLLNAYNNEVIGETTAPIDALDAFTQETNGANLQADAAMFELEQHDITPDFHLSGAMTNKKIADTATKATPYTLKISDMFTAMPYENSLVVISMNGPQLKAVLERSYRNYYYYKYVAGHGGYSYYTTCFLDINSGGKITYNDTYPRLPDGNNVVSLEFNGKKVDFTDASTYYKVSTVNYLAAGSCNMNDDGQTLWPLNQIANDTQYYVRDAVIDYVKAEGTVSPAIEGRVVFNALDKFFFLPMIGR
jgi:5'-nucleotidase/UDP-sugar diphosphatase